MKSLSAPPARRRRSPLVTAIASLLAVAAPTWAANIWDGGGGDGKWSTLLNWDDNLLPNLPAGLTFAGATNLVTNNDLVDRTVGSITFDATADAFVLGGNFLTLNGNIIDNSAAPQSINLPISLGAAASLNVAFGGLLTVGPDAGSTGIISGGFGLTKAGAGTLTLGATNIYTGNTTLDGGTLRYTATNSVAGLVFGAANLSPNVSSLELADADLTATSLNVQTSSGAVNTISISSGRILTVNGAFTIGANGVGLAGGVVTNTTISGEGTLAVNGTTNHFSVVLSRGNADAGTDPVATLNLSGLKQFAYVATTGELRVGAGNARGTLNLANTSNIITAAQVRIGDSSIQGPGSGNNNGGTSVLSLGGGTNVINTNTIILGFAKGSATFTFQSGSGSVSIAGLAGGTSTANITVGNASSATGSTTVSQFLLAGHDATVQAGTVLIGQLAGSTGGAGAGNMTFDTGTFNVNNLFLATHSTGTAPNGATGTVTIGGAFPNNTATGVLNVNSQLLLVNRTIAAGTQANGTLTINGGTVNVNANIGIVDSSPGSARNTTLTLAGGTLNMMGHSIGTSALPINTVNLPSQGQTATLANLGGTGINGVGLSFASGGTLILDGTNTYSGTTTITGGTLQVGTGVSSASLGSGPILNDGTLIINQAGTFTIDGGISGTGTIDKRGSGSVIVAGANNYTGATLINEGELSLTGSVGGITMGPGASLRTGYTGALTATSMQVIGGALRFEFDAPGPLITVAGAATFDAPSSLIPNGRVAAGTYTLLTANALTLTATPTLIAPIGTRKTYAANFATANTIKLVVTGASKALAWSGNQNGTWDLGAAGTQNWRDGALNETFFQADSVSFLDGPVNRSVTINGITVQPASVLVNNSSGNDYTISGSGAIGGDATLLKSGSGALSIATANTFAGGTTLDAGVLNLHHPTALGTGPLVIAGGSIGNASGAPVVLTTNNPQAWNGNFAFVGPNPLDLGAGAVTLGTDREITISASTLTVGGTIQGDFGLTKNGPGTLILTGSNGAATTSIASGTLQVGNGGTSGSLTGANVVNNANLRFNRSTDVTISSVISGAGDLMQIGSNILTLAGANSYTGATGITAGTIRVTNSNSLGVLSGDVVVSAGAALDLSGNLTAQALNFGEKVFRIAGNGPDGNGAITNGGVSQFNALQHVILTVDASVGGSQRFDIRSVPTSSLGATLDLAGHTLTKSGSNEFVLVGTDVSDGNIVVNQGTFGMETVTNVPDFGTGTKITMNAGTSLRFFNNTAPVSTVLRPIVLNGPGIRIGNNNNANSIIGSPMTLNGDISVETFNNNVANLLTLTGIISETGAHSITKNGIGTLFLAGANTYSGGTILNTGTLGLHHPSAIGTGTLTIAGGSLANQSGNAITLTGNNSQIWNADFAFTGTSPLNLGSGSVTLGGDRTLTVNDSELTVGGPISGAFALTKAGPGRVALNGINTYIGGTTVNAGALLVNGAISGALSVNGGILGGTGTVGVVTLSGGVLAPGGSPGILRAGGLVLNSGTFAVELDGQTPGQGAGFYDQVSVAGSVLFTNPITLTLDFSFFDPQDGGDEFAILINDGADPIAFAHGGARFVYAGLQLNEGDVFTAVSGAQSQSFAITYSGGSSNNDVVLHAVPEPTAMVALFGGLGVLAGLRRRRSAF